MSPPTPLHRDDSPAAPSPLMLRPGAGAEIAQAVRDRAAQVIEARRDAIERILRRRAANNPSTH